MTSFNHLGEVGGDVEYLQLLGDLVRSFLSLLSLDCISSIYARGYDEALLYRPYEAAIDVSDGGCRRVSCIQKGYGT